MKKERRVANGEVRAIEDGTTRFITLRILQYGVVDDYGSVWDPGVFSASLDRRMPTLAWGHDWTEAIGRAVSWANEDLGPVVRFRLDNPDDVPRARQAFAQVESGTIDDCSVGFSNVKRRDPTDDELTKYPGVREIIFEADLDEVSLVLRGAVPGAKVLALRSGNFIDAQAAARIVTQFANGDIDLADALTMVKTSAVEGPPPAEGDDPPGGEPKPPTGPPPETPPGADPVEPEPVDDEALDAEIEAALALVQ